MSDSPPPEKDVEQNAQQSGEEQDNIDRNEEGAQGQGMTDFEVKEQDRWLPIANGMIVSYLPFPRHACQALYAPDRCTTMLAPLKARPLIRLRDEP